MKAMAGARELDEDALAERLGRLARALTGRPDIEVRLAGDDAKVERHRIVIPADAARRGTPADALTGQLDRLAARARFSDAAQIGRLASPAARALAQIVDDRLACARLAQDYPGTSAFLARHRLAEAQRLAARWPRLAWRDRFAWRVERALWDEAPAAHERSPSLDAALAAVTDLLAQARAARSTADSVRAALGLVERVRMLTAGNVNNMMFSADADDTPDTETIRREIDFDGDGAEAGPDASRPEAAESTDAASAADTPSDPEAEPSGEGAPGARVQAVSLQPVLSIPLTTAFDLVTDLTGQGDPTRWRKLRGAARAETAPLKARLERALKADEQSHWKREQERGELDRPALARLATSPGYRTPFRVRRVAPGRDAAVSLLIDRSGSMAGRKIELAQRCAAALADALVQLGFACEVLGYSSIEDPAMRAYHARRLADGQSLEGYNRFVERLDLQVYKRFDSDDLSGLARIECGHENPDGEALAWAAERLLARRAQRRILMVLSDGYPATGDGNPAILRTDLRARIAALGARGVELIGVGILDDAVETFYPTSRVVEQLQDLPGAAFDMLGQALLNRRNGGARPGRSAS
ncbi:cobalamin biosynthesis protein CobT [Burkholderia sp. WAC0059]|uniref:cobaltochelatase CobT-related protein n=1 Tax=Burkholderia sp. WAC0059 TaxID=2066022 RepID=UPI000C7E8603|nr:VWA domain-containing protein [Burkholderia sp. WAC0059]PLZ00870.1 cobalamin biosynthesis protein CobT [Burkholderia sp. WAC0059]